MGPSASSAISALLIQPFKEIGLHFHHLLERLTQLLQTDCHGDPFRKQLRSASIKNYSSVNARAIFLEPNPHGQAFTAYYLRHPMV